MVPEPKRGGTFLYCPAGECPSRFRRAAKFRRHWRRAHEHD
jgi:uncharacterized C2H2 Zn-finger protein